MFVTHDKSKLPSAQELREWLFYDPYEGELYWAKYRKAKAKAGAVAGCSDGGKYRQITFNDIPLKAHRVIWCWMTGEWPPDMIDHKNRNGRDNRWENLREADNSRNQINTEPRWSRNKTGIKGVSLTAEGNFKGHIRVRGKNYHLGTFKTKEEARDARITAERVHFGDFAAVDP